MSMKQELAARLTKAREATGKDRTEAALALGVPYQTYAAHENGNRAYDAESAVLYARRFRVSLDWLLTGSGRGPGGEHVEALIRNDAEILEMLRRIDGLSSNGIDVAYQVITANIAANGGRPAQTLRHDLPEPAKPHHERPAST